MAHPPSPIQSLTRSLGVQIVDKLIFFLSQCEILRYSRARCVCY